MGCAEIGSAGKHPGAHTRGRDYARARRRGLSLAISLPPGLAIICLKGLADSTGPVLSFKNHESPTVEAGARALWR